MNQLGTIFDECMMNVRISIYFNFDFCVQGEGTPTLRKATCANHIRDVSKILTAHLTINARTEDDIDADRILEKLNSIRFAVKENHPRIEAEGKRFIIHYKKYMDFN